MKYDGNDGSATHILSFSKKDNKHIFKPFDYETIEEISNMTNISMSFKSSGTLITIKDPKGKRQVWSVLRLFMDELSETITTKLSVLYSITKFLTKPLDKVNFKDYKIFI